MKPSFYFDIVMAKSDIPEWDVVGQVWRFLHNASAHTKAKFAIAFPQYMEKGFTLGKIVRVFCASREDANAINDWLTKSDCLDYGTIGSVSEIKQPVSYEAYLMKRIPSGISKRETDIAIERRRELQEKRKQRLIAEQASLPFVRMRSSSGNLFKLVFERVKASADFCGEPNGYGLSRASSIVAVPVF